MAQSVVLPGDTIQISSLPPTSSNAPLKLGTGLHHSSQTNSIRSTLAGPILTISKNRTHQALIPAPHARYAPRVGDLVIGQVHHSSIDIFYVALSPHAQNAILPQLAFEGATKKTRPQLKPNDLVYAKVLAAGKNMEVEISCVNPSTGKSDPEGLGPLSDGMIFEISTGFAARLLRKEDVVILEELGDKLKGGFEIAVGQNGRVWVDCPSDGLGVKGVCAIGRCLRECDEGALTVAEQRKVAAKMIRDIGLA